MDLPAGALTALVVLQPESQLPLYTHPIVILIAIVTLLTLVFTAKGICLPNSAEHEFRSMSASSNAISKTNTENQLR